MDDYQPQGQYPAPNTILPTTSKVVNNHSYNIKVSVPYTPLLFLGTLLAYSKLDEGGREFLRYPLGGFAALYILKALF